MDKIIKLLLCLITVLCIFIISSIGLNLGCKIGVSDNFENINQVSLNLSYSYIAGLIFYFFTSYLPYLQTKFKLKPVIDTKINDLYNQIESYIQTFESNELEEGIASINLNSIEKLLSNKSLLDVSYYQKVMAIKMSNLEFINGTKSSIFDLIGTILEYKKYMPIEYILNIEKIRDSSFFHLLKIGSNNRLGSLYYNSEIFKEEFTNEFINIIIAVKAIKKANLKKDNIKTTINKITGNIKKLIMKKNKSNEVNIYNSIFLKQLILGNLLVALITFFVGHFDWLSRVITIKIFDKEFDVIVTIVGFLGILLGFLLTALGVIISGIQSRFHNEKDTSEIEKLSKYWKYLISVSKAIIFLLLGYILIFITILTFIDTIKGYEGQTFLITWIISSTILICYLLFDRIFDYYENPFEK